MSNAQLRSSGYLIYETDTADGRLALTTETLDIKPEEKSCH